MDIAKKSPTVLSLCTGYGGIEIGLKRVFGEVTSLAYVEVEAFAVANLVDKMETGQMVPAPVWTDVKTFCGYVFRDVVDIIIGGYPCQPFSAAGKRKGTDDPRHLWPHIKRIVRECRPRRVFFENVEGHLSLGVSEVLADLEEMGYTVTAGIFSAAEVGAPHQRKRVFILGKLAHAGYLPRRSELWVEQEEHTEEFQRGVELADSRGERLQRCKRPRAYEEGQASPEPTTERGSLWPARPGEPQHEWEEPRVVVNAEKQGLQGRGESYFENGRECEEDRGEIFYRSTHPGTPGGLSRREERNREAEPQLGRAINGTSRRVDRLRLLGNGVVPQVAEKAFITLSQELSL